MGLPKRFLACGSKVLYLLFVAGFSARRGENPATKIYRSAEGLKAFAVATLPANT